MPSRLGQSTGSLSQPCALRRPLKALCWWLRCWLESDRSVSQFTSPQSVVAPSGEWQDQRLQTLLAYAVPSRLALVIGMPSWFF
eukprot:SAG31_NODE_793_length_12044_cov_12.886229_16_plen_84_part_00